MLSAAPRGPEVWAHLARLGVDPDAADQLRLDLLKEQRGNSGVELAVLGETAGQVAVATS